MPEDHESSEMTEDQLHAAAQAAQDHAAQIPFEPAEEPPPPVVDVPGVVRASELPPANGVGVLEEERDRLREQVRLLQKELERGDQAEQTYDDEKAGSGHLEERIARVTAAMSRIPKRGFNRDQQYNFVAHSDVLDAVRPALAAEGISFRSKLLAYVQAPEERKTQGGMVWCMWRVDVEFSFTCWLRRTDPGAHPLSVEGATASTADVCEKDVVNWSGWAQDYSDKGASKALTSAIKTFLIQTFLISTGDDPDEPPADNSSVSQRSGDKPARPGAPVAADVRQARNAALEFNKKLPRGVLGKIAKRLTGDGVIMKIENEASLKKIAEAAERYLANPEGGEAWLAGEDAAQRQPASGEPDPADAERQAAAEQPARAESAEEYDARKAAERAAAEPPAEA